MGSQPANSELNRLLGEAGACLDAVNLGGVEPVDSADALAVIDAVERLARKTYALQVAVLDAVDRKGLHRHDGHASAKVLVRHTAKLSNAEASRRNQAAHALRDLPAVAASLTAGDIGADQVAVIGRAHANPRIRHRIARQDAVLAQLATRQPFPLFQAAVADWARLMDADGTADRAQRNHANRDARLYDDPDGSTRLTAACGALRGATHRAILDAYLKAEFDADWADARREHGDDATSDHLARTAAQRRADALDQIFHAAADTHAAKPGGSRIVTNIAIDADTFDHELRRFAVNESGTGESSRTDEGDGLGAMSAGARLGSRDIDLDPEHGTAGYRCSTLDGHPVAPSEVVAEALLGYVRRAVIGANGVVIDLGRQQRLFTGPAAVAVRLADSHCAWPGCNVPATQCQLDHLQPWSQRGSTNPGNGAPCCGRHNRLKHCGYTITRDERGCLHTLRPDGSEIP